MSTFAVFGMTRDVALAEARKTVKISRKTPLGEVGIPMTEWLALCEKRADEIMEGTKTKQLSPLFDSPQYADDFIHLARRTLKCRDMHIKARVTLTDEKGNPHHRQEDQGAEDRVGALRRAAEPQRGLAMAAYYNEHDHGQMARAAACYALAGSSAADDKTTALLVSLAWPWDQQWWKPRTARDNLVRAGALVLAEIERLDRAQAQGRQAPEPQTTGHDRLWHWFGLSRSAYAIMPRVMMHAMPDDWQDRMATLLEEWMAFWPNMPDIDACVQIRRAGRMIPTPPWLLNYRHPDRQHLADIHGGALERPSCVEP